jgi:hypothetical protein
MRKIACLIVIFSTGYISSAQKIAPHWQPVKIDSIKALLAAAKERMRIDLLNEISYAYYNTQMDSSRAYATLALKDAQILKYSTGIATALVYLSQAALISHDNKTAKEYALRTRDEAQKTNEYRSLYIAYEMLAILSKPEEGLKFLDTADIIVADHLADHERLDNYAAKAILFLRLNRLYDAMHMWLLYGELGKRLGDTESYTNALQQIARIYASIGDHPTAINYYNQVFNYKLQHTNQSDSRVCLEIGESYMQLKKFDSALLFFHRNIQFTQALVKDSVIKRPIIENGLLKKSEAFLALNQYDSALKISLANASYFKSAGNNGQLMEALLVIGNAYIGKKDFKKVLLSAKELVQIGALKKIIWFNKDAFGLLATAYHNLHHDDSAYYYLQASNKLRDSLFATNNYNNVAFFKAMTNNQAAETKINLLNQANRYKQQRLNILIASLISLVIIGFTVLRYMSLKRKNEANKRLLAENELQIQRLESEKKQASFQHRATELEMQALRAQMNPHFIFNCLNAINHFVLKNETETASAFLTKFSRLIRMVLQNSTHKNILLEDELATLRLYIELEQVRFNKRFQYSISVDRDIDTENLVIPPLLLQPFVENAIWHGLMHKDGEGLLTIELVIQNNMLRCTITDNGVGRENSYSDSFGGHKKSMGMQLTANRLKMLDDEGRGNFTIIDLKDVNNKPNGTKVVIEIPVNQSETVLV